MRMNKYKNTNEKAKKENRRTGSIVLFLASFRFAFHGGFVALFLVMSAMSAMLLGSLGACAAALGYSDSVARREYRLVASENARSCVAVALLAFAHDYFYTAQNQSVPDFSCTIVSAERSGADISATATSTENGVTASVSARATDNGRSIDLVLEQNI